MRLPTITLAALSLAATLAVAPPLGTQTLDPQTAKALAETLQVIQDPALRQPTIAKDPKAVEADRQVRALSRLKTNSRHLLVPLQRRTRWIQNLMPRVFLPNRIDDFSRPGGAFRR